MSLTPNSSSASPKAEPPTPTEHWSIPFVMLGMRVVAIVVILVIMAIVALSPAVIYSPVPRNILYALVSIFVAILLGAETSARFKFQWLGFSIVLVGTGALCAALLVLLTYLSKPEQQIAAFNIVDENGKKVDLNWDGALQVPTMGNGISANPFSKGNTLLLIFPEQVGEQEIRVKKTSDGQEYVGTIKYAGTRTVTLKLGVDLLPTNK